MFFKLFSAYVVVLAILFGISVSALHILLATGWFKRFIVKVVPDWGLKRRKIKWSRSTLIKEKKRLIYFFTSFLITRNQIRSLLLSKSKH